MNAVFFDGTIDSAGNVLSACRVADKRVLLVTHRRLTPEQRRFLDGLQDCNGSLGSFRDGRYVPHRRMGSPRHCIRVVEDGVEAFFALMAERDAQDDEVREQMDLLQACHRAGCRACAVCEHVRATADAYGYYDLL